MVLSTTIYAFLSIQTEIAAAFSQVVLKDLALLRAIKLGIKLRVKCDQVAPPNMRPIDHTSALV